MKKMNVTELSSTLSTLIAREYYMPVMVWGPPGSGKSSVIKAIALSHGLILIDVRLPQIAPTDLRGVPAVENLLFGVYIGDHHDNQIKAALDTNNTHQIEEFVKLGRIVRDLTTIFAAPDFLPRGKKTRALLFLDELNQSSPTMQGIAQQLLLDRRIGNYQVPEGMFIWAAGNNLADLAVVNVMPSPTANRMMHIKLETSVGEWIEFGRTQPWADEEIFTFLSKNPMYLLKISRSLEEEPAFPSPRTWQAACELKQMELDIAMVVGSEVAEKIKLFSLNDGSAYAEIAETILNGTFEGQLPQETDTQLLIASVIYNSIETPEQFANAVQLLPEGEINMLVMRHVIERLQRQGKIQEYWSSVALTGNAVVSKRIRDYVAIANQKPAADANAAAQA